MRGIVTGENLGNELSPESQIIKSRECGAPNAAVSIVRCHDDRQFPFFIAAIQTQKTCRRSVEIDDEELAVWRRDLLRIPSQVVGL